MRTNELRAAIMTKLNSIKTEQGISSIWYQIADENAMYPHIVFDLTSADIGDMTRNDYTLDIEVFTYKDMAKAEDIADAIEDLFSYVNAPQVGILPTFYPEIRTEVEDPDKNITRQLVRMTCQLYDRATS